MRLSSLTFAWALPLALAACSAPDKVDDELVAASDASGGIDADLAMITARFIDAKSPNPEVIGQAPLPCETLAPAATNTASDGQVQVHFAQCAFPGVGIVDGDVQLAYAVSGPTLHLDVQAGPGLQVDRAVISAWTASADVTASGQDRAVVWDSLATGMTTVQKSSRAFRDDASATLKSMGGSSCIGVDGQVASTFEASDGKTLSFTNKLSSFVACPTPAASSGDACPDEGSEVRGELASSGNFVLVRYAVGNTASYTNEQGQTFDFVPACAQ